MGTVNRRSMRTQRTASPAITKAPPTTAASTTVRHPPRSVATSNTATDTTSSATTTGTAKREPPRATAATARPGAGYHSIDVSDVASSWPHTASAT